MKITAITFIATLAMSPALAQSDGFSIKRVFESSTFSTTVVIEVPSAAMIKCAVYDANDNPLRVETSRVSPPIDEIMILTGDVTSQVQTAKCWQME